MCNAGLSWKGFQPALRSVRTCRGAIHRALFASRPHELPPVEPLVSLAHQPRRLLHLFVTPACPGRASSRPSVPLALPSPQPRLQLFLHIIISRNPRHSPILWYNCYTSMRFHFDPRKSRSLRRNPKRGIGFEEAQEVSFTHIIWISVWTYHRSTAPSAGWAPGSTRSFSKSAKTPRESFITW